MRLVLVFLLALPLAAHAADLSVTGAFSRATPGNGPGAAYLTLHGGKVADRLLGASSPRGQVTLHTMTMQGDVMRMRTLDALDIPAGATVTLAPSGMHLMIEGLKAPLKQGETLPLVLRFERAGAVDVTVPVEGVGATRPSGKR